MKKILVPTDFSNEAENAIKVAAQLSKKHNCKLILLHMLDLPLSNIGDNTPADLPEAVYFMKLARNQFDTIMSKDYLKDITVTEMVDFHDISTGILETCKSQNIDLIIMGSHGSSGIKEMFIGSNAEKIVRTSETPVLVIKNEHENFNIEEFVFASDFENDNKDTFKQATKLAEVFNAKIHLLMVNTVSNFKTTARAKVKISEFIEGTNFANYTTNIYNDETVEKGILNFSHIIDADLIGISTHGRQGIAHFLNGSLSEDLVNHAKRPVITFKI